MAILSFLVFVIAPIAVLVWTYRLSRHAADPLVKHSWKIAALVVLAYGSATIVRLVQAFDAVGNAPAEHKAAVLAESIAGAMQFTLYGTMVLLIFAVVVYRLSRGDRNQPQPASPNPVPPAHP